MVVADRATEVVTMSWHNARQLPLGKKKVRRCQHRPGEQASVNVKVEVGNFALACLTVTSQVFAMMWGVGGQ